MSDFITGLCVACLVVVPVAAVLFHRKARQVRDLNARKTDVDEELTRLTGELAHEIRNPLSTIKINLKLTEEALAEVASAESGNALSDPHRQRLASSLRKITVIQKEMDRLEQILDGFLRYVRRPDLQLATTDLNELVSDMIDFYSPQAHSHALTVRHGFCAEPLVCRVDPGALKQVLLNLFINAQQAMDHGGELLIRTFAAPVPPSSRSATPAKAFRRTDCPRSSGRTPPPVRVARAWDSLRPGRSSKLITGQSRSTANWAKAPLLQSSCR